MQVKIGPERKSTPLNDPSVAQQTNVFSSFRLNYKSSTETFDNSIGLESLSQPLSPPLYIYIFPVLSPVANTALPLYDQPNANPSV